MSNIEEFPLNFMRSFDARDWAAAFMRQFGDRKHEIDEGLMLGWFANAIMCGWDEHARRYEIKIIGGDSPEDRLLRQLSQDAMDAP
jgi:hypothetical protein